MECVLNSGPHLCDTYIEMRRAYSTYVQASTDIQMQQMIGRVLISRQHLRDMHATPESSVMREPKKRAT